MPADRRVHLIVVGRVQGVCFRDCTRGEAQRLGVTGFVRNLPTGDVEILAEGPEDRLNDLLNWCRRGSPGARVIDLQATWEDSHDEFDSFRIAW
jgi:acylphosphatase